MIYDLCIDVRVREWRDLGGRTVRPAPTTTSSILVRDRAGPAEHSWVSGDNKMARLELRSDG